MLGQKQHVAQDALRVFVSSRMDELAPERRIVRSTLLDGGFDPWVFEVDAGARPGPARETYLQELVTSDVYVGIFWKGFGTFTADEFDAATREEIPRLVYEKVAAPSDRDPALQTFLDELGDVERGVTIRRFHEPSELGPLAAHDLEWVQDNLSRVWSSRGGAYTATPRGGRYDRTAAGTPIRRDPLEATVCLPPPDPFVDRYDELDRARAAIASGEPLLGFRGEPGIGKTAVLRSLAHDAEWTTERFPHGVGLCLDAGPLPHVGDLLRAIWSEFYRVRDRGYVPDDRELRRDLGGKRALIFVDDFDLPADQVTLLSDSMRRSVFVVAGHDADGGRSDLGPMAYVKAIPLEGLRASSDMVAVFGAAYGTSVPRVIESRIAALCRDVQGSPGRISKLASEAWGRGGDLGDWVEERVATALEPVASMLEERRSPVELGALMFHAAFGSDAATPEGVAHRLGITDSLLDALVEAGDVEETLSHRLTGATYVGVRGLGRPEEFRGEVFDATVAWVGTASQNSIEQSRGFILRVLAWGAEEDRKRGVLVLARALDPPLVRAGAWGSWGTVVDHALDAATALGDDSARAWALHEKGTRALMLGERRAARRSLKPARRLRRRLGEPHAAAVTSHNLGFAPLFPPILKPFALVTLGLLSILAIAFVLEFFAPAPLDSGEVLVEDTAAPLGDPSATTGGPVNRPPLATDSSASVDEGARVEISVLADETDPDNAAADLTLIDVSTPENGRVDVQGGVLTYVHDGSETTSDSITYRITDGDAESNEATVTIAVQPVNDPPEVVDHLASVDEGGVVTTDLLDRATDADNEAGDFSLVGELTPSSGRIEVVGGVVTYIHDGSETTSDSFTYRITDGETGSNEATVTIAVQPTNDPPNIVDHEASVNQDESVTINLLTGAIDPDNAVDELTVVDVSLPGSGRVEIQNGVAIYVHEEPGTGSGPGSGQDSFTYRISDGEAVSNDATVTITVNHSPIAFGQVVIVVCGSTSIELTGFDPDGDPLDFGIVRPPTRGTLSDVSPLGDAASLVVYTPSTEADDSFVFSVSDGVMTADGVVSIESACIR